MALISKERWEAAHKMICDICYGVRRWKMTIPPQPSDSDVLLSDLLRDAKNRIAELEQGICAIGSAMGSDRMTVIEIEQAIRRGNERAEAMADQIEMLRIESEKHKEAVQRWLETYRAIAVAAGATDPWSLPKDATAPDDWKAYKYLSDRVAAVRAGQLAAAQDILRLRRLLISVQRRRERKEEEGIESVEQCQNCGDKAREHIDIEEWTFDEKGDMLCRFCGADRPLCGFDVGGVDDLVDVIQEELNVPPSASEAEVASNAEKAALFDLYEKMSREGIRPGVSYSPDTGFHGWNWRHDTYPTLLDAMRVAAAERNSGEGEE